MFRQDRTNPSSAVSNWKGRKDTPKAWVSTAVSSWLNGGLFGGGIDLSGKAGYFLGGYGTGAPQSIEQWTFPADVGTLLEITLGQNSRNGAGFGNDGVAGYNGVGEPASGFATTVDKLTYANGVLAALGTGLSAAARGLSAMSNVAVAGYVSQGDQSNTYTSTVDKFAYSDDSRTTLSFGLSETRSYGMAFANSGTAGYIGGGYKWQWPAGYTFYTTVNKWSFSDDSRTTLSTGILSTQSFSPAGMANSGTAGYCLGGGSAVGTDTDSVTKFAFSDDSRTTLGTGLSADAYYSAAMADSGVAGYNALSQSNSYATDVMNKFAFSDDSRSTLATVIERNLVPSAFANCSALSP